MSRSFFPSCSSQKVEMEEMYKELDDLRSEVETLKAECHAKSELANGLKRVNGEQLAKLQEAKTEIAKQAHELVSKDEEISLAKRLREELESKFAEKEQALKHLGAAYEGLKNSFKEKMESLEAEKKELMAALDEAETRRQEQGMVVQSCKEEIERIKRLLSESQKKCSDAEQRALAPKEVRMRDEMLAKLEEEKAGVEGKLKWKIEQFRHLEEALKKVQDEFRAAKREWGSERLSLVDQISTLQTNLDSKTRVAEDFRSRLEMCSQALAHEESRRKLLEVQMSELRDLYGSVVSEYEEARSTFESLTAKRDGDIALLRSSLAEKVTLLKELEYGKAHLEQENEELWSSLKEYQEAQIGGADAVVSLKALREKFRAMEQTHRGCTEKLKAKEVEFRMQMEKFGNDLDECLLQLGSRDRQILQLQNELVSSYTLLERQIVENWEISVVLMVAESKFYDSCLCIDTLKLKMEQHCEKLEEKITAATKQLGEENSAITRAQAEKTRQSRVIETLHARIEQLESIEQEYQKMHTQLDAYKEMLDNSSRNVHCLKDEASKKENGLQEELRKALAALDEANCALAERKSELSQVEIDLQRQKPVMERLEMLRSDMEIELKGHINENQAIKRDLNDALMARKEVEESLRETKERSHSIIEERDRMIEGLQQHIAVLEEENVGQKLDVASLVKSEVDKSIREVNNRYSEIVEVFDKKLLELETRLSFFEPKYGSREHEILEKFDQEEADWYKLIEEKENAIADVQLIAESLQLDVKQSLEAAARKLAENQTEIGQLYGFVEKLRAVNLIQEHDMHFRYILVAETERELEGLQLKLILEEEQSVNLKNVIEQLRADTAVERLEKAKEQLEIANELKSLQHRKEILEEQVGEFKSRTKALYDVTLQERKELVDDMTGFTDTIGTIVHRDKELMKSWERIMQKFGNEESFVKSSSKDFFSSEKTNARNSMSSIRSKSGQIPDRRSPLKDHNC